MSEAIREALNDVGKFEVKDEITQGMNGYAFKAYHRHLDRDVFLKVVPYVPNAASEILTEPRLLVKVTQDAPRCENVVQVYDADFIVAGDDQYVCLQMELVNGNSLLSVLLARPLGQQEAVRITAGVLSGLSHLHRFRVLHRDIKPANVLLADSIPKIGDFGSAAFLPKGIESVRASKHSALYVPPEAWESDNSYTVRSDVYQAGMVLYELVNGPLEYRLEHYITKSVRRNLAKSGLELEAMDDLQRSRAADQGLRELGSKQMLLQYGRQPQPYLSKSLNKIINKATAPNPSKRFSSAEEFLAKLNVTSVPDWYPLTAGYFAPRWRGWDWRVKVHCGKGKEIISVTRSRSGVGIFRKLPKIEFGTLEECFHWIEACAQ